MTTILHGNIIHAPSFGALETVPNGYLILEDGVAPCRVRAEPGPSAVAKKKAPRIPPCGRIWNTHSRAEGGPVETFAP